ncbi:MAG: exodeoxyribonuclease III [Candidatus Izemoplasmataceae bacterium]
MYCISWNVNGLRAVVKKGFMEFLTKENPDILALQEIKMKPEQADFTFKDYHVYYHSAERLGYSGTLVLTKQKPLKVSYGIDDTTYLDEGRIITCEFDQYYFVTAYVPNTQRELTRLDYRMQFEDDFRSYLKKLDQKKPVIYCGDLNVAHEAIDLKNPLKNERNAGFTIEERNAFSALLKEGFIDTFRTLYPDTIKYSWWSYMFNSRKKNIGWRIDYFLVSKRLKSKVKDSLIYDEVLGSDHCPIALKIDVS